MAEKCLHNAVCKYGDNRSNGMYCTEEKCKQFKNHTKYAEVVHAEWLDGYGVHGGIKKYESIDCSNCGDYFKTESNDREYWKERFKVCPFCGAVMDGERKDNERKDD